MLKTNSFHLFAALAVSLVAMPLASAQPSPPFAEMHPLEDDLFAFWTVEMIDLDQDGDMDIVSGDKVARPIRSTGSKTSMGTAIASWFTRSRGTRAPGAHWLTSTAMATSTS